MLQITNLGKRYNGSKVPALDNVTIEVRDGEVVGFVGLNGAGKTTTIRISAGVSLPSEGTVSVEGHDIVREKQEASKEIGWVPEYPIFEQNARVMDLMVYFAGFHGIDQSEARRRAEKLLDQAGLKGLEQKKLRTYSQGMKKRFSLANALLHDPKNLLLDEVLNGLDPEGIQFVRSIVADSRERNRAILLSSHILTEVQNLSDRVVFLHKGRVIGTSTREDLLARESNGRTLRMQITNLDEAAFAFLKTLGDAKLEGTETVILSNPSREFSEINTEIVRRGLKVKEYVYERSDLEAYLFQLVKDAESRGSSVA